MLAPPEERALMCQHCEIQSLLRSPLSCAIRHEELLEWMVGTTIDPYNSKTGAQVIQRPDDWHSV